MLPTMTLPSFLFQVHFLAKGSLFDIPILGRLIRVLNSHPVARGASDAAVFRTMLQLISEGKKLILFPEGQRTRTGDIQPLERGLAFLVQKAKCPVIPAYIQGSFKAWRPGKAVPKFFGKMTVVFGSSIEYEESGDKKGGQARITAKTEESIRGLKAWLENGALGPPP